MRDQSPQAPPPQGFVPDGWVPDKPDVSATLKSLKPGQRVRIKDGQIVEVWDVTSLTPAPVQGAAGPSFLDRLGQAMAERGQTPQIGIPNPKTGQVTPVVPRGTSPLDMPAEGVRQMGQGFGALPQARTPDQVMAAGSDLIEGLGKAGVVAFPAFFAVAPVVTLATLTAAYYANQWGATAAKAAGLSAEGQRFAGNVAMAVVVGGGGRKAIRGLETKAGRIGFEAGQRAADAQAKADARALEPSTIDLTPIGAQPVYQSKPWQSQTRPIPEPSPPAPATPLPIKMPVPVPGTAPAAVVVPRRPVVATTPQPAPTAVVAPPTATVLGEAPVLPSTVIASPEPVSSMSVPVSVKATYIGDMGESGQTPIIRLYNITQGGNAEHPVGSTVSEQTLIDMGWKPEGVDAVQKSGAQSVPEPIGPDVYAPASGGVPRDKWVEARSQAPSPASQETVTPTASRALTRAPTRREAALQAFAAKKAPHVATEQDTRELRRMLQEMNAFPYERSSYAPLDDMTYKARQSLETEMAQTRGQRIIGTGEGAIIRTSGHAGAPVFTDILQNLPERERFVTKTIKGKRVRVPATMTGQYSRGQVQHAILRYLETGKVTDVVEGALAVARARMGMPGTEGVQLIAKPMPWDLAEPARGDIPARSRVQEEVRVLNDDDLVLYYQAAEEGRRAGWTFPEESRPTHAALRDELDRRGLPVLDEASYAAQQSPAEPLAGHQPAETGREAVPPARAEEVGPVDHNGQAILKPTVTPASLSEAKALVDRMASDKNINPTAVSNKAVALLRRAAAADPEAQDILAGYDATEAARRQAIPPDTPPVDVNQFGEAQLRLPDAESVRNQHVKTPEMEAPFSLTGNADTTPQSVEQEVFVSEPNPSKAEAARTAFHARQTRMKTGETVFVGGDKARYTGHTTSVRGKTFYEVVFLEGDRQGKKGFVATPPTSKQARASDVKGK